MIWINKLPKSKGHMINFIWPFYFYLIQVDGGKIKMKKMPMNGKLYNVITMDEYAENPDLYNAKFTAIETASGDILPIVTQPDDSVGIYYKKDSMALHVKKPNAEEAPNYNKDKMIDYSNLKDIREIINKDNLVRDIENDILTTKDNIFELNIRDDDSPEMVAVKKAINLKQVDVKQYEPRFTHFQNDIRILKDNKSITLGKLITACNNFDIAAELILKDKEGCANPMNTEIKIDLTGGDDINESK